MRNGRLPIIRSTTRATSTKATNLLGRLLRLIGAPLPMIAPLSPLGIGVGAASIEASAIASTLGPAPDTVASGEDSAGVSALNGLVIAADAVSVGVSASMVGASSEVAGTPLSEDADSAAMKAPTLAWRSVSFLAIAFRIACSMGTGRAGLS